MRKLLLILSIVIASLFPVASTLPAVAVDVCPTVANGTDACAEIHSGAGGQNPIIDAIKIVITVLSYVIGVIAVFVLILGGIRFATSQGDSQGVATAKSAIVYALIALVIAASAQLLVRFVLNKVG